MTWRRFRGTGRQADQWASPHERATTRAAERLDWPLEPDEAEWLDRHLAECDRCASVAEAYADQAAALRAFRDQTPPPPRDLWARTAAAIEAESRGRRPEAARRARPMAIPLGVLSGALVVAVIIGASLLQNQPLPASPSAPVIAAPPTAPPTVRPGATPLSVPRADDVAWFAVNSRGEGEVHQAPIDEVCPETGQNGCAPIDGDERRSLDLEETPLALVQAPDDAELVVVEAGAGDAGGDVFVVPAGTPAPGASASPSPRPTSPAPTDGPSATSPSSPAPPATSPPPTTTTSPSASPTGGPTAAPTTAAPPSPPVDGAIAIATDVVLVGEVGYSPDGTWLAFSAKPADGSMGPDVFVWRSGQRSARPITTDHASVFSSWLGDRILASRIVDTATEPEPGTAAEPSPVSPAPDASGEPSTEPEPSPIIVQSEAILIDPATGETVHVGSGFWRPTVDPRGRYAVYFDGPLAVEDEGFNIRPAFGQLVLGTWPDAPEIDDDPSPAASPGSSATASPTAPSPEAGGQVVETGTIADWDARWDATGTRLAVWVTDGVDPTIGRLNLFEVDPATGRLEIADRPVANVPALRGFSIADSRLAWVTPPGQDGEGSRVQIIAWTADDFGSVETLPAEEDIVVIR